MSVFVVLGWVLALVSPLIMSVSQIQKEIQKVVLGMKTRKYLNPEFWLPDLMLTPVDSEKLLDAARTIL